MGWSGGWAAFTTRDWRRRQYRAALRSLYRWHSGRRQTALARELGDYLAYRLLHRKEAYRALPRANLISFLTPAFNTAPEYLEALARTIFQPFESSPR
jgi:hypothetical protein